jgi:hypothetical protein
MEFKDGMSLDADDDACGVVNSPLITSVTPATPRLMVSEHIG